MSLQTRKMNYENVEVTVIVKYFADLSVILYERIRAFNIP